MTPWGSPVRSPAKPQGQRVRSSRVRDFRRRWNQRGECGGHGPAGHEQVSQVSSPNGAAAGGRRGAPALPRASRYSTVTSANLPCTACGARLRHPRLRTPGTLAGSRARGDEADDGVAALSLRMRLPGRPSVPSGGATRPVIGSTSGAPPPALGTSPSPIAVLCSSREAGRRWQGTWSYESNQEAHGSTHSMTGG